MVEMAPASQPGLMRQGFAGDTFNTLHYLRQLCPTWTASYVSAVGQDQISDQMLGMMTGNGVDISHVRRIADRTVGLYLITLKEGERSFSYWRSQSAARLLAEDRALLAAAFGDSDVVYFSGITLAILTSEARVNLMAELAAARHAGKTIVFDTNLRPRLWADADTMRATVMAGAAVSDMVLPSFDEEAAHFGDADPAATLARYQSAGAPTVVVKNGPGAIHYVHGAQSGQVQPDPGPSVVDTTSAGDSFNAGLLAGMATRSMPDAITLASRVARQVIGQRGALVTLVIGAVDPE